VQQKIPRMFCDVFFFCCINGILQCYLKGWCIENVQESSVMFSFCVALIFIPNDNMILLVNSSMVWVICFIFKLQIEEFAQWIFEKHPWTINPFTIFIVCPVVEHLTFLCFNGVTPTAIILRKLNPVTMIYQLLLLARSSS